MTDNNDKWEWLDGLGYYGDLHPGAPAAEEFELAIWPDSDREGGWTGFLLVSSDYQYMHVEADTPEEARRLLIDKFTKRCDLWKGNALRLLDELLPDRAGD